MDAPPPDYAAEIVQISDRLIDCGVERAGLKIEYIEDFQRFEIAIGLSAAREDQIPCIHGATGHELVVFEDVELQRSYDEHVRALLAPRIRAETESFLAERGLLDSAPTLESTGSIKELAIEIERLCGFEAGSMLKLDGDQLTLGGEGSAILAANYEKTACLLALIRHSGITNFGFIGNEKYREPND